MVQYLYPVPSRNLHRRGSPESRQRTSVVFEVRRESRFAGFRMVRVLMERSVPAVRQTATQSHRVGTLYPKYLYHLTTNSAQFFSGISLEVYLFLVHILLHF